MCQKCQCIGQCLPVGVMEMARHLVDTVMLQRGIERTLHLDRRSDADGVGDADMLHADVAHQAGQHGHALRGDLTFVRTADGA